MNLCLAIPSYRDSARLRRFLPALCAELGGIPGVSVLVVDDGSGTAEACEVRELVSALQVEHALLRSPLCLAENVGKGGAVYAGWDAAPDADWLGFVDADGAVAADEVGRIVRLALDPASSAEVYLASRVKMLGRDVRRSTKRHLVGRVFATLASLVTGLGIYDSQCGCKILKARRYREVRPRLTERRFAFDIDLLWSLAGTGAVMREVPVDWADIPGSKVSLAKDGIQMASALWRLRHNRRS